MTAGSGIETPELEERRPRSTRRLAWALFAFGLLVCAATRFAGLTRFPIFFFCDEAIQANVAQDLYENHFRDREGVFLPPYFLNHQRWAMSLNIYLLLAPVVLLGKTILVTRGTFVVVSLLGAAAGGLALKSFAPRAWWTVPLLMAAMPIVFLHSRVAFETTDACYAGFLCAYLLYRLRDPRWAPAAIALGGAVFYSYTAGQGIMLVMGILLLVVDGRYHFGQFRRRPVLLAATLITLAIVVVPLVREQRRHPHTTRDQLVFLQSYLVVPAPATQKLATFGKIYLSVFDPRYWFSPTQLDLARHRTGGMAYVPPLFLPLLVVGIGSAIAKWRSSPGHRVILLSPLGVPFAACFDRVQVLRVLPMVVPIALLTALGIEQIFRWVRRANLERWLFVALAVALAAASARIAAISLTEGPMWSRDYGLYGMQYGAAQVMKAAREELLRSPSTHVFLSSTWANNPEAFIDFFLAGPERARAQMGDAQTYLFSRAPLTSDDLFIMTPDQFEAVSKSNKLVIEKLVRTVPWPDGRPGFFFVRMRYSAEADREFAEERAARRRLIEETAVLDGKTVRVRHSMADMGSAGDLFDRRPETLMRGLEANPFILEVLFPEPREISRVRVTLGSMEVIRLRVRVTPTAGSERSYEQTYRNMPGDPTIELALPGGPVHTKALHIEIEEVDARDTHIHVRELSFL